MPVPGSNWINLQDYLGLNKEAGAAMGQKVAGDVGAAAGKATQQLAGAQDKFATQRAAGSNEFNPYDAQWSSATDAKAKSEKGPYSGPKDVNDTDPTLAGNVSDAVARVNSTKTAAGQQQALSNAYGPAGGPSGTGGGALDSFLLSTGGGSAMADLQKQYGDLGDKYSAATQQSAAQAGQSATDSAANAQKWGAVATQKGADMQGRTDAKAAEEKKFMPPHRYEQTFGNAGGDTPANRQAFMMSGVDQKDPSAVAARQAEIAQYEAAQKMTTQQQMDSTFEDFNDFSGLSGSTTLSMLGGSNVNAQTLAQKQYGSGLSLDKGNQSAVNAASGSTSQNHIPWDKAGVDGFFVWRQMTPQDWATLNSKPKNGPNGQIAWINTKEQELRNARGRGQDVGRNGMPNELRGWR